MVTISNIEKYLYTPEMTLQDLEHAPDKQRTSIRGKIKKVIVQIIYITYC